MLRIVVDSLRIVVHILLIPRRTDGHVDNTDDER